MTFQSHTNMKTFSVRKHRAYITKDTFTTPLRVKHEFPENYDL